VLLGRDRECAAIDRLLDQARESCSGALVLRGEPGIGKSALLDYARDRADGMRVLGGTAVEAESELPFAGLHQLLWPVLDRAEDLPSVQGAALRGAFALTAERVEDRFLVSVALLGLLTTVAEDGPLLCVVDDAHWLDQPSADALRFAARRLHADPIALLLASRDDDARRFEGAGLPELRLTGLADADAAALLDSTTRLPGTVRHQLVQVTHGNPLALLELPRGLSEDQRAGRTPLLGEVPLTTEIEQAFLAQIRPLPEQSQRLLLLAAADDSAEIGTVLAAAERLGLSHDALDAAERARLIDLQGQRLRFRHPLVRSAVYRAATSGERREAHDTLASVLVGERNADRHAWHRAAAAVAPDEEAAAELERTAEHARARGGHAAAARALERAAELGAVRRGDRLLAAARAAVLAGRMHHASSLLTRAEPELEDLRSRAEAARIRAEIELAAGRPGGSHDDIVAAAQAVQPVDRYAALRLLGLASEGAALSGRPDRWLEASRLGAAIEPEPGNDLQAVSTRLLTGYSRLLAGDVEGAAPLFGQALVMAEELEDPRQVLWAAGGGISVGDRARALRALDRAIVLIRERAAVGLLLHALGLRANLALWDGRLPEAAADADEAVRLARDIGAENARTLPLASLAWLTGLRGDEAECRRLADEVLELAIERGLALPAASATWALAQVDLALGRWDEALVRLLALEEVRPGLGHPMLTVLTTCDRVEAAVRCDRPEVAERSLERFAAWAAAVSPGWAAVVLEDCRALVAPAEVAERHFKAALRSIADARPLDRARVHLHYGEHLRRERRRIDARVELRTALEGFEGLGASPWAERARRELRATGETARKRDTSPLAELTPQELQVARLVSEGATNKAVAAQLFVSPKTVEYHLRKVFAKLGIASRSELFRLELGADHEPAMT
jgi:DNA-binding CsgD family transcriptional regulator